MLAGDFQIGAEVTRVQAATRDILGTFSRAGNLHSRHSSGGPP